MVTMIIIMCLSSVLCFILAGIARSLQGELSVCLWGVAGFIMFIVSVTMISGAIGSKNTATLYNNLYKTKYTTEDIFWNSAFIKDYLVGEKKNINLNINGEK